MSKLKSLVVGGGCFWCIEAIFERLKGVYKVKSGYAGGHQENPSYKEVCSGLTGHTEVIKIDYNEDEISLETLLSVFFTMHNPTTLNRQGNDVGTQYRSAVYSTSEDELERINHYILSEASQFWTDPIVTETGILDTFYPAENYHDSYYQQNKSQGYCQFVIAPKMSKLNLKYADLIKK